MGIQDRDYYREQQPGFSIRAPRTIVGMLILANVVVFVANLLLTGGVVNERLSPQNDAIAYWFSVKGDTLNPRYFEEPCRRGALDVVGRKIDRCKFSKMLDEFYHYKGLDKNGRPLKKTLKRLGLDKEPSHLL